MSNLVVVSGGTRGIGKAIVEKFAKNGFDIAVCSRSVSHLNDLKSEIETKYNVVVYPFQADASIKTEIEDFARFALSLKSNIQCLVNNAGLFLPGKILEEPSENLQILIETNVMSAYYLSKILVPEMQKLHSAHVFNICSIASLMAYPQSGSYSISKFALLGFSKSLREELKNSNVKVTSVMPGATFTDSWAGVELPESRFMKAEDIADTIWSAFSLSPSAVVEEIVLRPLLGDI